METTLYNHNSLGCDTKPLIPNIVFAALLHLIDVKDNEAVEYILKNYTLTAFQSQMAERRKTKNHD